MLVNVEFKRMFHASKNNTVNREIFAPLKIPRLIFNIMVNALELKFSCILSLRLIVHS
jgi:hypothetical protein